MFKKDLSEVLEIEFKSASSETRLEIGQLITNITICQNFQGWTLDYVEGLLPETKAAILGVLDGQNKAQQTEYDRAKTQAKARRH